MPTTRTVALAHLVEQLDASLGTARAGSWLVRVADDGGEAFALGLLPLDAADHPVDALLGFVADPSWTAVGVIVHGHAHDVEPAGEDPAAAPVRLIHLIDRDGAEASVLRRFDGSDPVSLPGPSEGRLADCCRRVLGLATGPAPSPPLHWQATIWLDAVLRAIVAEPVRLLSWAEVQALHPMARRPVPADPVAFAAVVERTLGSLDWESLRLEAAAADDGPIGGEIAAWMDAGMFARWRLAQFPEPVDLLIDLAGLLPASAVEPLVQVIEAWGLW